MRLNESSLTGACLLHLRDAGRGGRGIREGESVGAVPQGSSRLLLFSQDSASETENRWRREGEAEKLARVLVLVCVLCLPSRGVNRIWLPYCAWYYPCCSMLWLHCFPGYCISSVMCCKNTHWLLTYLCHSISNYAAQSTNSFFCGLNDYFVLIC